MEVIKRNGQREPVSFDKVTERIRNKSTDLTAIDPTEIALEVIKNLKNGIKTTELDRLTIELCASRIAQHPDYNTLASRIFVSNLHKSTESSYEGVCSRLGSAGILDRSFVEYVQTNALALQEILDFSRDYRHDYFGLRTLENGYLLKIGREIVERPQHMWLRVAIQIHQGDLSKIRTVYDQMSQGYYTHATPTLFNSGCPSHNLASCFLLNMDDTTESIFETVSNMARISKCAGGIGVALSNIRAKDSIIRSTQGKSNGIIPLCKVLESVARFITQSGKRLGSIACYLEPWHADIEAFLDLRKNTGDENLRCRDLFIALWVPDLFMKRVESNGVWSLMCPDECPGLTTSHGDAFETLYKKYESEGRYKRQVPAREIWTRMLEAQMETGMPYIVYKDSVNRKNNQSALGTIQCSNLCAEILIYSSTYEYGTCNLASLCLPRFVRDDRSYDYEMLGLCVEQLVENLNRVIDTTTYPTPETERSNKAHRPIGLGVQGLANVYALMRLPFESPEAQSINRKIFETIYYHALRKSSELAESEGTYSSFAGSPFSKGQLQWHLWGLDPSKLSLGEERWNALIERIRVTGVRNSLLTALMPTASTSQIMRCNEGFEPFTSNLYVRKTLAGEHIVVNEHLVRDLMEIGKWSREMYEEILYFQGSVQRIREIPQAIRDRYKTAFEMRQVEILRQASERGPFIDQTQSMNLFMASPDSTKLNSAHFWGWRAGLKTGMYYLRTQPAVDPLQFGLDVARAEAIRKKYEDDGPVCVWRRKGQPIPEGCVMCSA